MPWQDPHTALERFLHYVRIDTESDAASTTYPSTAKQFDLLRLLKRELEAAGASGVELDEYGYVTATIPSTVAHAVPVVCFCSHVDTTSDVTGANVRPQVHEYAGGPIVIDPVSGLQIDETHQPYLAQHRGHRVVTASGDTLLGADDKAGVAAIMDAALYLLRHPEIPHGDIRVLFTPDEEVGRGVDHLDMTRLGADFGYTLDGGEAGGLEGESFSADAAMVRIEGVSVHPGYAQDKMVSAIRAAAFLVDQLPQDRHSPESTSGREGFVHCVQSSATAEAAELQFLLRDFDTARLDEHFALLQAAVAKTRDRFPGANISVEREKQYRNMGEVLRRHPEVMEHARTAIRAVGLDVKESIIRGGTDGSRLSFMGLPCPNLFTGMQMIHSRREWVGERDMNLAAEVIVELAKAWASSASPRA